MTEENLFTDMSLDTLKNVSKESNEYKFWIGYKKQKNSVSKYINLIYIPFCDAKIMKELEYNKEDSKFGPFLFYKLINNKNNESKVYINRPIVYSYSDMYEVFHKEYFPAYNINNILNYIQEKFNIKIWWNEIDSPCTKKHFVIRLGKMDDDPIYLRNFDNEVEFPKTSDGYRDAAKSLYLFYIKKYIYTINKK